MFDEANGGLRPVRLLVKEPEELLIILPVPAGVLDVFEGFLFNLARDVVKSGESVRRRRRFMAQIFFKRETEFSDARENLSQGSNSQLTAQKTPTIQ